MVASKKTTSKLAELRKLFTTADGGKPIHAYIVPTEDPHMVSRSFGSLGDSSLCTLQRSLALSFWCRVQLCMTYLMLPHLRALA